MTRRAVPTKTGHTSRPVALVAFGLIGAIAGAAVAQPTFISIEPFPLFTGATETIDISGVSADGRTATGSSKYVQPPATLYTTGFRWTESEGKVKLAFVPGTFESMSAAVNANGTAFAGYAFLSGQPNYLPLRWPTPTTTQTILPPLGWSGSGFNYYPQCTGISADGTVVVGFLQAGGTGPYAFRSVNGSRMNFPLTGSTLADTNSASGVSPDGTLLLGSIHLAASPQNNYAFRWSETSNFEILPLLPGGNTAVAVATSADNSITVGYGKSNSGTWTILWTGGNAINLGGPQGSTASYGRAISADGSRVAGYAIIAGNERAAFWANTGAYVNLNTYFPAMGINLTGWVLTRATGISADGTVLVGNGTFNGKVRGWYAKNIPAPCVSIADMDHDYLVELSDFFAFFNCWDASSSCADIDGTPGVDLGDFFAFLNAFDVGC